MAAELGIRLNKGICHPKLATGCETIHVLSQIRHTIYRPPKPPAVSAVVRYRRPQ